MIETYLFTPHANRKRAKARSPMPVSSAPGANERHGNYLCDNTRRLLDEFLADGKPVVLYT
jgi:hypothetical protein